MPSCVAVVAKAVTGPMTSSVIQHTNGDPYNIIVCANHDLLYSACAMPGFAPGDVNQRSHTYSGS